MYDYILSCTINIDVNSVLGTSNSEPTQAVQMEHSGVPASGDDDNVEMDNQPEIINAVINRVVGNISGLMTNRIPNLRMGR